MSTIDWIVLLLTLLGIVTFGIIKSRKGAKSLEGYFLGSRSMHRYLILLSIMGTQASAITFLSAPGQAFTDGMRFLQYYFGLPLAMVVLCVTFVPLYSKLKIYTAYEFLEKRFDSNVRTLTASLFLLSRGLSTGISIYAPSIIISSLLGWDIFWTNIFLGGLLIIYTVVGGAKAIAQTQQLQLFIIFGGMLVAGAMIIRLLPEGVGLKDALLVSGANGKLNVITSGFGKNGFDFKDRYNIISGLIGGFFLSLSYFGTDQSQVGRYLAAKNITESKVALLLNGLVKVPMQFLILLLGALLFTFYSFNKQPIYFDKVTKQQALKTTYLKPLKKIEDSFEVVQNKYIQSVQIYSSDELETGMYRDSLILYSKKMQDIRNNYKQKLCLALNRTDVNDTNYIFLDFVVKFLPKGLVGLLIAVIFLAAWGSIAAALHSLASSTMIDFHIRFSKLNKLQNLLHIGNLENKSQFQTSQLYTLGWGIFAIITAEFASGMGSLIEAVNILGSLFYGVMLGIFLVAFYCKRIDSRAVFYSAIVSECFVIGVFILDKVGIIGLGFLWLNVIGTLLVVLFSYLFLFLLPKKTQSLIKE